MLGLVGPRGLYSKRSAIFFLIQPVKLLGSATVMVADEFLGFLNHLRFKVQFYQAKATHGVRTGLSSSSMLGEGVRF